MAVTDHPARYARQSVHQLLALALAVAAGSCAPGKPLEGNLADPDIVAIHVSPATVSLAPGEFTDFSASADLSDGGAAPIGVNWSAAGGTINGSGHFTAGASFGAFQVIGTHASGLADTATVTIGPAAPVLTRIDISPSNAALLPGAAQQFDVVGVLSDSSTTPVSVTWSATGGTVTSTGNFLAPSSAGTYVVIARQQGGSIADTARITVGTPPVTLTSIAIAPAAATLEFGKTQQFNATGFLADGSTAAVTVTWTATGGSISSSGVYTAGSTAGTFRVIGRTANQLADTSAVTITAPTVISISIAPVTVGLSPGQTQQFRATATLSNATTQNNATVNWTATGGTVSGSGLYTAGNSAGIFRVIGASANGQADTSTVNITIATVTSFTLTPVSVTLPLLSAQQFTAVALWSDGIARAAPVTYSATGGTISIGGLFLPNLLTGQYEIIATCACGLVDTSFVNVVAALPPPTGVNQNEPAGYSKISDQPFTALAFDGWRQEFGNPTIVRDNTGPASPENAVRATYGSGTRAGSAPFAVERALPGSTELYVSLTYKLSSNFQGEDSGTNKMGFVWIHDNPAIFFSNEGSGSGNLIATMRLQGTADSREYLAPNLGKSGVVTRDTWHTWELQLISNSAGGANGTVRWWLDGTLIGQYTDVKMSSASQARTFQISSIYPIWGGVDGTVSSSMSIDFDNIYLSGR